MEVSINCSVLSVEFDKTSKREDLDILDQKMKEFFFKKEYLESVAQYDISLICVSPGFQNFFNPRRPKYYKDKCMKGLTVEEVRLTKLFSCELVLNYDAFILSDKKEGYNIIANTVMRFLEELKYPIAIKKFDKKSFNEDMKAFFIQMGCNI